MILADTAGARDMALRIREWFAANHVQFAWAVFPSARPLVDGLVRPVQTDLGELLSFACDEIQVRFACSWCWETHTCYRVQHLLVSVCLLCDVAR